MQKKEVGKQKIMRMSIITPTLAAKTMKHRQQCKWKEQQSNQEQDNKANGFNNASRRKLRQRKDDEGVYLLFRSPDVPFSLCSAVPMFSCFPCSISLYLYSLNPVTCSSGYCFPLHVFRSLCVPQVLRSPSLVFPVPVFLKPYVRFPCSKVHMFTSFGLN